MSPGRRFDLPVVDADTAPWWRAAADHRLLLRRCRACDAVHHYPRPFCPVCWSDEVEWVEASGRATLYTYSVVYRNDLPPFPEQLPYVAAVVELEEGPRMMTQVVGCAHDLLAVGMPLRVRFQRLDGPPDDQDAEGFTVPVFTPATP